MILHGCFQSHPPSACYVVYVICFKSLSNIFYSVLNSWTQIPVLQVQTYIRCITFNLGYVFVKILLAFQFKSRNFTSEVISFMCCTYTANKILSAETLGSLKSLETSQDPFSRLNTTVVSENEDSYLQS